MMRLVCGRRALPYGQASVLAAVGILAMVLVGCKRPVELPVLATLPEFALTDERNQPLTKRDLAGQVWVADFIFTNCPGACIRMSKQFQQVQASLPGVRLVSFSVDPARDTPAVMAAYARRNHADAARWRFVVGPDVAKVSDAAMLGRQGLDHSTRFLLVDRAGRLRATYQSDEPDAVARLLKDADALLGQ